MFSNNLVVKSPTISKNIWSNECDESASCNH